MKKEITSKIVTSNCSIYYLYKTLHFFIQKIKLFIYSTNIAIDLSSYLDASQSSLIMTFHLSLLHSERPKLYIILAFLSAIGLKDRACQYENSSFCLLMFSEMTESQAYLNNLF